MTENIFLGNEESSFGLLKRRRMRRETLELMHKTGLHVPLVRRTSNLRLADRQKIELLKALARNSRVLIMDEPTAALPAENADQLHEIMRTLRDAGTTVVYVSHFLEHVLAVADDITVMRNGRTVRSASARDETTQSIISSMLGRPLDTVFQPKLPIKPDAPVRLELQRLRRKGAVHEVSLRVRSGEILGVTGLVGSGRTELLRMIYGADKADGGKVLLDGEVVRVRSPRSAVRKDIAFVPEDRKDEGLMLEKSASDNLSLPSLRRLFPGRVVSARMLERFAKDVADQVAFDPGKIATKTRLLSGGNQQKLVFGRWLGSLPRVLLIDEPTRGVDIGASGPHHSRCNSC